MKLKDLREKLKREKDRLLEIGQLNPSWDDMNMRELWMECHRVIGVVDEQLAQGYSFVNRAVGTYDAMRRVIRTGDVYYYAKKHGLEAAMVWKLSQL